MPLLPQVVDTLCTRGVPFALIGAAAMAAHGVSRSTYDIDLFTVSAACLDIGTWRDLQALGIEVDVRVGDEDDPLLGVVRITHCDETIDVVVGRAAWQRGVVERARPIHALSVELPLVTVDDLILLKLYAGGLQDRWDIEQLLLTGNDTLVLTEVDGRVRELPARSQALWQELRALRAQS
ncbi:MAG TPA: hypothetical protein VF331_26195 [Polyangiales bacterium]